MISWIKRNKLATVLLLIVVYFLTKQYFRIRPFSRSSSVNYGIGGARESASLKMDSVSLLPQPQSDYTPTTTTDRMVVQESNLSLVVKDVRQSSDKAIDYAKSNGGYMVSSSLSQPQEAPYACVVLRIPADKLKSAVDFFRSLSIKVSSENLLGTDVTDQYTDLNARLQTLNQTKAKFEEILNRATQVQDILTVQRELINLQNQIDDIKGQQQYLEKTAQLAKVSLYLSTDEFSLPYTPTNKFRPSVIFKQAVRAMVVFLILLIKIIIWVGVFGVIWIPVLLIVRYFKKKKKLH